jgi:hypothetical protein
MAEKRALTVKIKQAIQGLFTIGTSEAKRPAFAKAMADKRKGR